MNEFSYLDQEFDAMPGRGLSARWTFEATLTLTTAAHFGGRGDSALDMPVLRCAKTDRPLLPGTSVAGALRAYVLDRLAGYGCEAERADSKGACWATIDKTDVAKLFGGARGDDQGAQSPLIVFDALGALPEASPHTEVRDGVMIETATGTAADHKKFDFEVLPPGTAFEVRFDVLVPQGADESALLSLLCAAFDGLRDEEIHIGMRRSRGLGELSCANWKARRFELSQREGWLEWIGSDHEHPTNGVAGAAAGPADAIEEAWRGATITPSRDKRKRIVFEADADLLGDVLIRVPNRDASGPDVMQLTSGGKPVVSGTSLTGVIRAQALRIAQLVRGISSKQAEDEWIAPLFGPREKRDKNPRKPEGSRLRVSERAIAGGREQRVTRVAIDRFTQGTVPTALFEEQPHVGGTVSLRIEIRDPRKGEDGLLLLVLKDLLTGQLPIGGASSVGRGALVGRRLKVDGEGIPLPTRVDFTFADARAGRVPASDQLNARVAEFVNASADTSPPEQSSP